MNQRDLLWLVLLLPAACVEARPQDLVSLSLEGEGAIELRATWKAFTDSVYGFGEKYPLVRDLKPAQERASYTTEAFQPFLPRDAVHLGQIWRLDAKAALPFLRQLHPGATDRLHHGWFGDQEVAGLAAPGAWASLRAVGPEWAEIVMRVHAEFLLDGDGVRGASSWLTPAQFEGRLVIDREKGTVAHFELALPDQSANVDINIGQGDNFTADIGRIPKLELASAAPEPVKFEYRHEIGIDVARRTFEREIYPYGAIDWLPLNEALAKSKATGKPLHVIALFGSLLDESC